MRWQMESTFQEARQRLGFETQRHWSELAIRRTAPALLSLFSLVTLFAHRRTAPSKATVRRTAWHDKPRPTFSDALALVGKELWAQEETYSQVAVAERHGESPAGICGAADRRGLLRGVMAKV
jgi:hypothetical protein